MKKLLILMLALAPAAGFAIPADVVYSEGDAFIRYSDGEEMEAMIGDVMDTGDTVTTGLDGFVELDREGVVLKINPETVFALLEREADQEQTDVLNVVLGSIRFRYDRITGKEPKIQTISCVAGVRGTEFTVFSGVDGSSLIVVDQGEVAVEAEGRTVSLTGEEGVEVAPGRAPGEKFTVQRDQIDYSKWNDEKLEALLADPVGFISNLQDRMKNYISQVSDYYALYLELKSRMDAEIEKQQQIAQTKGKEASEQYFEENVFPLTLATGGTGLNVRYFTLAAFSLRRYIAGRMYLSFKTRYIMNSSDSVYTAFLERYQDLLADFEESIVPHLVEADI
jgi:hypothetical protein